MKYYQNLAIGSIVFVFGASLLNSCVSATKSSRTQIRIETSQGDIQAELYNETPMHKEQFVRLIKDKFYDGVLFHRVIKDFMIQGGDPLSKDAKPGELLGTKDEGEPIMPEFRYPRYFHKRGAIAAARENDQTNPEQKSSGSQFYIVWGRTFTDKELDQIERNQTEKLIQDQVNFLYKQNQSLFSKLEIEGKMLPIQIKIDSLRQIARSKVKPFSYPDSIRTYYRTIGGTPWLDGNYTVFGEVTKGLDIIEKIQNVAVDKADRPIYDIKMKIRIIK